jgi:hypothetical protein
MIPRSHPLLLAPARDHPLLHTPPCSHPLMLAAARSCLLLPAHPRYHPLPLADARSYPLLPAPPARPSKTRLQQNAPPARVRLAGALRQLLIA